MRPMWMEYPLDNKTFGIDTNYMFGDAFLVAASFPDLNDLMVYLPPTDDWYHFQTSLLQASSSEVLKEQLLHNEMGKVGKLRISYRRLCQGWLHHCPQERQETQCTADPARQLHAGHLPNCHNRECIRLPVHG